MTTREQAHNHLMHMVANIGTPCTKHPNQGWISDKKQAQQQAAQLCNMCPLLRECLDYIETYGEPTGAWAGLTQWERTAAGKPKPAKAA